MGSGATSIHEIPPVAGVRVVFNGFRRIACNSGCRGGAFSEIALQAVDVISLTTGAENLSATAYSGEFLHVLVDGRGLPPIPPQTDK
jgi:hypothetical protein